MTTVPHAHTHARTILVAETPRGGGGPVKVYPNRQGKPRGDENRGVLRVGIVEANKSTEAAGLAGLPAAVTHEEHGEVRFYVWYLESWVGPHWALSEEIVPIGEDGLKWE